jgi:tetratricopeptide (TPR) repeat protein
LYRRIGDKEGSAEALDMLGLLLREKGGSGASIRLHEESLRLRQEVGDRRGTAYTLSQLGKAALYAADYERGVHYFAQGLALRREIGNLNGIAASLNMLGWAMVHQGNYDEACTYFEEGLEVCQQLGDKHIEASMLKGLGYALLLHEEQPVSRVRELFAQSLAIFQAIGDIVNVIEGIEAFAALASAEASSGPLSGLEHSEEAGGAIRLFSAAEALRDAIGAPMSLSNQLLNERLMYRVRSQLSEAEYERLCKEGREMTMEQAIACTLKG